ncbi:hypothetical protein QFZ77_003947 [Paenibacillus sp. V4I3]|nr:MULTISPECIES: hypothetical protein [unclassified Paenibacillus]MDQ0875288.1 hypothetical protein [Paenibacillus sp. V4I3]MDQ0888980.1 hypothetical protein [Paenibacillus sp. V4I9]
MPNEVAGSRFIFLLKIEAFTWRIMEASYEEESYITKQSTKGIQTEKAAK